jgi:hypothetical protein
VPSPNSSRLIQAIPGRQAAQNMPDCTAANAT